MQSIDMNAAKTKMKTGDPLATFWVRADYIEYYDEFYSTSWPKLNVHVLACNVS